MDLANTSRRGFLTGLIAAPAVIRTPGLLMPVKAIVTDPPPFFYVQLHDAALNFADEISDYLYNSVNPGLLQLPMAYQFIETAWPGNPDDFSALKAPETDKSEVRPLRLNLDGIDRASSSRAARVQADLHSRRASQRHGAYVRDLQRKGSFRR